MECKDNSIIFYKEFNNVKIREALGFKNNFATFAIPNNSFNLYTINGL